MKSEILKGWNMVVFFYKLFFQAKNKIFNQILCSKFFERCYVLYILYMYIFFVIINISIADNYSFILQRKSWFLLKMFHAIFSKAKIYIRMSSIFVSNFSSEFSRGTKLVKSENFYLTRTPCSMCTSSIVSWSLVEIYRLGERSVIVEFPGDYPSEL